MNDQGAWIKVFTDGTRETGTDDAIALHKASWSNGCLSNINSVILTVPNGCTGILTVPNTDWFQFDRFIAEVQEGQLLSKRIYRVVQAKVQPNLIDSYLVPSFDGGNNYSWIHHKHSNIHASIKILSCSTDMWISLIVPSQGKPHIIFSRRGHI